MQRKIEGAEVTANAVAIDMIEAQLSMQCKHVKSYQRSQARGGSLWWWVGFHVVLLKLQQHRVDLVKRLIDLLALLGAWSHVSCFRCIFCASQDDDALH